MTTYSLILYWVAAWVAFIFGGCVIAELLEKFNANHKEKT